MGRKGAESQLLLTDGSILSSAAFKVNVERGPGAPATHEATLSEDDPHSVDPFLAVVFISRPTN